MEIKDLLYTPAIFVQLDLETQTALLADAPKVVFSSTQTMQTLDKVPQIVSSHLINTHGAWPFVPSSVLTQCELLATTMHNTRKRPKYPGRYGNRYPTLLVSFSTLIYGGNVIRYFNDNESICIYEERFT